MSQHQQLTRGETIGQLRLRCCFFSVFCFFLFCNSSMKRASSALFKILLSLLSSLSTIVSTSCLMGSSSSPRHSAGLRDRVGRIDGKSWLDINYLHALLRMDVISKRALSSLWWSGSSFGSSSIPSTTIRTSSKLGKKQKKTSLSTVSDGDFAFAKYSS